MPPALLLIFHFSSFSVPTLRTLCFNPLLPSPCYKPQARSTGKAITSRIDLHPSFNITQRSTPAATPAPI